MNHGNKFTLCVPFQYICEKCNCCTGSYLERIGPDLKCSCGGTFVLDNVVMECLHLKVREIKGSHSGLIRCLGCNSLVKEESGASK